MLPGVGINGKAGQITAYWADWVLMGPVNFLLSWAVIYQ
jgi:hypothetical protein